MARATNIWGERVESKAISVADDGSFAIAGIYSDIASFNEETLPAAQGGRDMFLTRYRPPVETNRAL